MISKNLNYAYYIEYYKENNNKNKRTEGKSAYEILFREDSKPEDVERILKGKNREFCKQKFSSDNAMRVMGESSFELKTSYPGLVMGTGIAHQFGGKGEAALGFSFDYVTGMPYLPSSSVKGVLRSAFKKGNGCYIDELLKNEFGFDGDIKALENQIFGPENDDDDLAIHPNSRDVFFDAVLKDGDSRGEFMELDNITPHRQSKLKELAEPNPITFLKIRPDVVFSFSFKLTNYTVDGEVKFTAKNKLKLFKIILTELGAGAKTNVGYGVLTEVNQCRCKLCKAETKKNKQGEYYEYCSDCANKPNKQK